MARTKTIIKHCAKCNKPFSTADDSIVLCGECTDKKLKDEAAAELERQSQVVETRTCRSCGHEYDITVGMKEYFESHDLTLPNLCPDCRKLLKQRKKEMGGMTHVCKTCGKTFTYTPLNVLRCAHNGWELFEDCPDCRKAKAEAEAAKQNEARKKVVATLTCKDCGKEFNFTEGEKEFMVKHGLEHTPVRCPDCRHKRKVMALAENMRRFGGEDVGAVVNDETALDTVEYPEAAIVPPDYVPEHESNEEDVLDIMPDVGDESAKDVSAAVETNVEDACPTELPYDGDDMALTDVEKAAEPVSDVDGDAQENEAEPEVAPEMDTQEPANMEMAQPAEVADETESVEKADA